MGSEIAGSALAAAALALARDLDNAENSATSHANCAKALLAVMNRLRELAPANGASDTIDKIAAKRGRRRERLHAVK